MSLARSLDEKQHALDIEMLARMAARLAGRDPDKHHVIKLAGTIVFDDVAWRYPDFLARAEAAYALLDHAHLIDPREVAATSRLRRSTGEFDEMQADFQLPQE